MKADLSSTDILEVLRRKGTRKTVAGMARYGIVAKRAFGVPMGQLKTLSKRLGKNHALAVELWDSGWYEARLLAALVGEPEKLTRRLMDQWARDFENWADCDTACFALFDRSPLAWERARQWSRSPKEFVKRGGFVLMACLALHDKTAPDKPFLGFLPLIEQGARDERNFVSKGVNWALRSIGRRNRTLKAASLKVAERLATASAPAPRWVGKDAARQLRRA